MTTQARPRESAQPYRRPQRPMKLVRAEPVERPGPLEFDENGFPIPQRQPSFTNRVARLRSP